jgi:predicted Zn-dependent peptidase
MDRIRTSILDCGMPLVTEHIPGVRSVGLTWLLPMGCALDPDDRVGRSTLYEELILRGAGSLDSRAQADAFDVLGVSRGTSVETFSLVLSATMLNARVGEALPLLVDTVLRPRFEAEQLEPVRALALQSLAGLNDDPQERVMLELRARHAPPPINRSPMGTAEGIRAVTAEELAPAWASMVVPGGGQTVLALAGDVDHDRVADALNTLLRSWKGHAAPIQWDPTRHDRGRHHLPDQTNQVHIAIAHDAPPEPSPDAWLERATVAVLSGGMAGRLFAEVREKRGLCYSVYATYGGEQRYGRGIAYAGTTPERAGQTLRVLTDELERINTPEGRVTENEFARAIVGMKSRLVMSGESTSARAASLARDYRKIGRARSLEELSAEVDAITLDALNDYLARRSLGMTTTVTIGPEPIA